VVLHAGACLHSRAWRPHASTGEPQRQTWRVHKLSSNRYANATPRGRHMRQLAVLLISLHCGGWLRLRAKLSVMRPSDSFPAELGLTESLVCPKPNICVTGPPLDGDRMWQTYRFRMSQKSHPGMRDTTTLTPGEESGCSSLKPKSRRPSSLIGRVAWRHCVSDRFELLIRLSAECSKLSNELSAALWTDGEHTCDS